MHKLGVGLIQKYDNDIRLLERSLNEENSKINTLKKALVKNCDVDGSNVVYRNALKLNATQVLPKDTEIKIKDYLKNHLTNFKPHNPNTQTLIEEIKAQNAKVIKESAKSFEEMSSKCAHRGLKNHELIEQKQKERYNKEIKEKLEMCLNIMTCELNSTGLDSHLKEVCNSQKLNFTILPNLNYNTKVFINLDVQYDFIPSNEEYLRKMRLDFISKKDKIIEFVRRRLIAHSHKKIFITNSFQNDYQEWKKRIEKGHHGEHRHKVERFDIWNNKKKRKSIDDSGYEREAELFKQNRSDIPKANFNLYTGEFFYVKRAFKKILDPIRYDYEYKATDLWSIEDIKLFIIKYLSSPKDFDTISSFFYNKTTRDIINFYFNFRHHLGLKKHAEEVYGPNFIRKHINKKIDYITEVASRICRRISSTFYKEYETFSKEKFHQPVQRFTTYQLLQVFAHLSTSRKAHQIQKMEQMYEEAKLRDNTEILKVQYSDNEEEPEEHWSNYFKDIEENGSLIEKKLLMNFSELQKVMVAKENEIYSYAPILNLNMNKLEAQIPQYKICETIALKKQEK